MAGTMKQEPLVSWEPLISRTSYRLSQKKEEQKSEECMCPAQIYTLHGRHKQDFSFKTVSHILYGMLKAK